ncbi:28543_t:CDS:1, partial [Gigaspora margarita]
MSDIKCSFCPRIFANLNDLSKHMTICVKKAKATSQIIANNSAHICNNLKPIKSVKQKQKDHIDINKYYPNSDINEYYSNSEFFAKTMSFKDIKFQK